MTDWLFPPQITEADVREMVARYRRGESLRAVAEAVGYSHEAVRLHLIRAGVPLRPRSAPKATTTTTTTPEHPE